MAADTTILQGEVIENPQDQKLDVERLLAALLHSLVQEQKIHDEQKEQVRT